MIATAWELGGHEFYEPLNLRRWAHMLGFRGHFLSKSQRYSVTFRAMRAERRLWRLREDLAALERDTHSPDGEVIAPDLDTIIVINEWVPIRFGHRDHGERELALAIAERGRAQRQQRRTDTTARRAAA